MEQALNQFNNQVQNIPFFGVASGIYEDQAGERFSTKDPFYEKVPKKDPKTLKPGEKMEYDEVRRKPPTNISESQRKLWKKVMKRAWYHDRNFCGCMPIDLGCGMISIVSIFPLIGSFIAYKMHYKLIKMCNQAGCPAAIQAKMVGNIGVDFAISLVPLLGVLFSWMKASSTRNAAMFDTWLRTQGAKHSELAQSQNQRQQKLEQQARQQKPSNTNPAGQRTQAQRTQAPRTQAPAYPAAARSRQQGSTGQTTQQARAVHASPPPQTRPPGSQSNPARSATSSAPQNPPRGSSSRSAQGASRSPGPAQGPAPRPQPNRQGPQPTTGPNAVPRKPVRAPPSASPYASNNLPRNENRPGAANALRSQPAQPQMPQRVRSSAVPPAGYYPQGPQGYSQPAQAYPPYPQYPYQYQSYPPQQQYPQYAQPGQWRPPPAGTYYNVEYTR